MESPSPIDIGKDTIGETLKKIADKLIGNVDSVVLEYREKDYAKKAIITDILCNKYKCMDVYEPNEELVQEQDGHYKKVYKFRIKRRGVLND